MPEKDIPDLSLETAAGGVVIGIDEAGRGPWAGPVVAACVWLDPERVPEGINDSKKLSARQREALFDDIRTHAKCSVGIATAEEIDALNILQATFLAMRRAYDTLNIQATLALVDGNKLPGLPCPARPVIGGDALSLSIAAASIIAKVTRDQMMREFAQQYPAYGFERHAGYGTRLHQEALQQHGPCPIHRKSFAPIRAILEAA